MKDGFTTRARLRQAEDAYRQAELALLAVRASQPGSGQVTDGASATSSPALAAAQAEQGLALRNLDRTVVRAPISGRVSQTSRLQIGQSMSSSTPALNIVADNQSWVQASFKETDLGRIHTGQQATVGFSAYPGLHLKGHVESIGTASEQGKDGRRVAVRIRIDEPSPRQLVAGISAQVTIDIKSRPDLD
jgi:membrane fusion protein (multidrug efflux system)